MSEKVVEIPAMWIAGAACSGCSVSLLNTVSPNIQNVLVDQIIPGKHVSLKFHATVMAGQGKQTIQVIRDTEKNYKGGYVLCVEGSISTGADGNYCTIGMEDGKELTMQEAVESTAKKALAVLSIGSCASFGGIPSGAPNPTGAISVKDFLANKKIETPVVNIPGCPPHPDWIVGTLADIIINGLPTEDKLDELSRPKAFFGTLIHDNCPRRAYFDAGKFAENTSDEGCLYEIGCKGPLTYADCPLRHWNNGVNWCIGAGAQCIGCVEPGFHDDLSPMFKKLDETLLERFQIKTR